MEPSRFSERLLRSVWNNGLYRNTPLTTTDGRPVTVIDPGCVNTDGGPDFRNARIRIGGTLFTGDVELHCEASSWYGHGHECDGHYNSTILHVVFSADPVALPARTRSGREIPMLVIDPEDAQHIVSVSGGIAVQPMKCHGLNSSVPESLKRDWIEKLARQRLELKVRRFEERLKELIEEQRWLVNEPRDGYRGSPDDIPVPSTEYSWADFANKELWEQLLYEGILEALGYSKNRSPFLALAQAMKLSFLRLHDLSDTGSMMALLFGAAGLLPSSRTIANAESRRYLLALRRRWRELRPSFSGPLLQPGDWLFFRLRPSNFPTIRLASACFLLPRLFGEDSFRMIITSFKEGILNQRELGMLLHSRLHAEPDAFWRHHYYFGLASSRPVPGIGRSRRNDMIVNVLLPIVLLYARVFRDQAIRDRAGTFFGHLPPLQSNGAIASIEQTLFGGRRLDSASQHQGATQLHRMYCSTGRCSECEIGKTLGWG